MGDAVLDVTATTCGFLCRHAYVESFVLRHDTKPVLVVGVSLRMPGSRACSTLR